MKNELSDKATASLQKVVDRFKAGDLSAVIEVARIQLAGDCPAAKWTLRNRLLAYMQCHELDCRGYRQWEEVGRKVKTGTHGVYIARPWPVYGDETDPATGKPLVKFMRYSYIAVHPASHTEGEPIADYVTTAREPLPLTALAERLGIEVNYGPLAGALGWASHSDKIMLGTHDVAVWFHELAHRIHARVRGAELSGGQDPHQETTAELASCVLMDLYGYDRTGNAWRYISGYNDDPLKAVEKALTEVQAILDFVFEEESCDV